MSEPEAKLTAYQQRCRKTCQWCAKGIYRHPGHRTKVAGRIETGPTFHEVRTDEGLDVIETCTAPNESQFAEEKAQENARLKREDQHVWEYLAKATGHNPNPDPSDEFHNAVTVFGFAQTVVRERDQWREKFEREQKLVIGITDDLISVNSKLAARDTEITSANRRAFEISLEKQMAVLNLDQAQQEIARLREALQGLAYWLPKVHLECGRQRYTELEEVFSIKRIAADVLAATAQPSAGPEGQ